MSNISAIIIAKNEEEMIADCLDSLTFCDEIIVVDNQSEDRTKEIAEKMGARVITCKTDDFSKMRTEGYSNAKCEWILYVDADERVTKTLEKSIIDHASAVTYQDIGAYTVKRKNFYFGNHEWPYVEKLERLFKKGRLIEWYGKVHESPKIDGEVGELNGFLMHYTHRDLSSMLKKTIEWSKIEAQLRISAHHPKMTWWRFPKVMIYAFLNSYVKQQGWRVGTVGIIESIYQSFSAFVTYARLWEMQNSKK